MLHADALAILRCARDSACLAGWVDRHWIHIDVPCRDQPGKWGALTRKGLLRTGIQSEWPIGERRREWTIYYITPAGRAALEEADRET